MGPNWIGLLVIGIIAIFIFGGRGRISSIMGDVAKGITSFRKGLKEDPDDEGKDAIDVTPPKEKKKTK